MTPSKHPKGRAAGEVGPACWGVRGETPCQHWRGVAAARRLGFGWRDCRGGTPAVRQPVTIR